MKCNYSFDKKNGPLVSEYQRAVKVLRDGGVVAFPTETFYGLAVDIRNERSLTKLFSIKKREKNKPILVLISSIETLKCLVSHCPTIYKPLIDKYWPGALTLIFPANKSLLNIVTGGTETIGVRISSHPVASELSRQYGYAISATSANISGMPPASNADEIRKIFGNDIDYILDGGQTEGLKPSTIINQKNGTLEVVRKGAIEIFD